MNLISLPLDSVLCSKKPKSFKKMCRRLFVYDESMDALSPEIVNNLLYIYNWKVI